MITVMFDQFNASLQNTTIAFFQTDPKRLNGSVHWINTNK